MIGAHDRAGWSRVFKLIDANLMPIAGAGRAGYANVIEVARAHVTALYEGKAGSQYILSGPDHSILEFANEIRRQLGKRTNNLVAPKIVLSAVGYLAEILSYVIRVEPPVTSSGAFLLNNSLCGNDRRAQAELGYRHIPLESTVRQCLEWMKAEGML